VIGCLTPSAFSDPHYIGLLWFTLITMGDVACVSRPQLLSSHLQPVVALFTLGCFGLTLISLGCCDSPQPFVTLFTLGCGGVAPLPLGHCGVTLFPLGYFGYV